MQVELITRQYKTGLICLSGELQAITILVSLDLVEYMDLVWEYM